MESLVNTSTNDAPARPGPLFPPPPRRAWTSLVAWIILLVVLAGGLTLDLTSKSIAFAKVGNMPVRLDRDRLLSHPDWMPPPHAPVDLLPGKLLDLQLVINRGAVFGIGENQRFFFIAFTVAALVVGLFVFGRLTSPHHRLAHIAIGLVLAGGLGNLYDRIAFGVVRDFLHMLPDRRLPNQWTWPGGSPELFPWVFNIADVMLLIGMAILMFHMSRVDRKLRSGRLSPVAKDVDVQNARA